MFSLGSKRVIVSAIFLVGAIVSLAVDSFDLWDRFFPDEADTSTEKQALLDTRPPIGFQNASAEQHPLAAPVEDMITSLSCKNTKLESINVAERVTPAEDSFSGFEGHYIEGEAVLVFGDTANSFRLVGNGKGPGAASAANSMALRGLAENIRASDEFLIYCEGN